MYIIDSNVYINVTPSVAEEQPGAAAGVGAGAGKGSVRRRRATRQAEDTTGTLVALEAASAAPRAEKGAGASGDAFLTDLFSAMDLSITVQEQEVGPRGGRGQQQQQQQQQEQQEERDDRHLGGQSWKQQKQQQEGERETEASEPRAPRRRVQAVTGRGSQVSREEEQDEGPDASAAVDAGAQPGALRRRLRSRVAADEGHVAGSTQVPEGQQEGQSTLPVAAAAAVEDVGAGADALTGLRRRRRVDGAGPAVEGERSSAGQQAQGLEQQQQQQEHEEQLQGEGTGRVLRRRVRTAETTAEAGVGAAAVVPAPVAPAQVPAETPAEEAPREARFGRRGRTADPPPFVEGEGVDLTDLGPWPQQ